MGLLLSPMRSLRAALASITLFQKRHKPGLLGRINDGNERCARRSASQAFRSDDLCHWKGRWLAALVLQGASRVDAEASTRRSVSQAFRLDDLCHRKRRWLVALAQEVTCGPASKTNPPENPTKALSQRRKSTIREVPLGADRDHRQEQTPAWPSGVCDLPDRGHSSVPIHILARSRASGSCVSSLDQLGRNAGAVGALGSDLALGRGELRVRAVRSEAIWSRAARIIAPGASRPTKRSPLISPSRPA